MKKRILLVLTVLTMLLCIPLIASAQIIDSGSCGADGDNVTWTLDDEGTLTISGTGDMYDFASKKECPWYEIRKLIKNVKIESGVTSIGDNTDIRLASCDSITIPRSITKIGKSVFSNSNYIDPYRQHIYYESNITEWKKMQIAEEGNNSIDPYVIVYGDTTSSDSMGIVVSGSYSDILSWTLDVNDVMNIECVGDMNDMSGYGRIAPWEYYKTDIKKVVLPEGLTRIGSSAFEGCVNLTEVNLPEGLTEIAVYAFKNCSSLKKLDIPKSVTHIGDDCFSGTQLINEKNGFQFVGDNILVEYTGSDQEVIIPDGVRIVADGIFSNEAKENMTKLVFSEGVEYIGVILPSCKKLVDIKFPSDLITIEGQRFDAYGSTLWYDNQSDGVVYIEDIAYHYNGKPTPSVVEIKEGTRSICGEFFGFYAIAESAEKVILPDSIERIEGYAFSNYGTEIVSLPQNLKYIGTGAFVRCNFSSDHVKIPDGVTRIGEGAFSQCKGIKSVEIPHSLERIASRVFYRCSSLTSVTIPENVTSIGRSAFSECEGLTDVYYSGTEEQWKQIVIDSDNDPLLNATIHYNIKPLEVQPIEPIIDAEARKIEIPVTVVDEARAEELNKVELYIAEYDENGRFVGLKLGEKGAVEGDTIIITANIPDAENYKIMLWDANNAPLMDAVDSI